jgi:hypothetical protein
LVWSGYSEGRNVAKQGKEGSSLIRNIVAIGVVVLGLAAYLSIVYLGGRYSKNPFDKHR